MNEVRRTGEAASRRLGAGEAASRRLLKRYVLHFKQSGGTPLPLSLVRNFCKNDIIN